MIYKICVENIINIVKQLHVLLLLASDESWLRLPPGVGLGQVGNESCLDGGWKENKVKPFSKWFWWLNAQHK
jgi:hypothetical protein